MYHSLYIRSIIKVWERAGKVVKSCRKVYSFSIYRVYIIKEYKGKGKKVAGKGKCGKECFPYIDIV